MKFVIDANLPYSLKMIFGKKGKTWHTRDLGLSRASDEDVLKAAIAKKALLVTMDLEFGNTYIYPNNTLYGIIIARIPFHFNVRLINEILDNAISSININEIKRAITVIEPGRIRIRRI